MLKEKLISNPKHKVFKLGEEGIFNPLKRADDDVDVMQPPSKRLKFDGELVALQSLKSEDVDVEEEEKTPKDKKAKKIVKTEDNKSDDEEEEEDDVEHTGDALD